MTLVIGRWEARGRFQVGPVLDKKSDLSPFGDLPGVRLVSMRLT